MDEQTKLKLAICAVVLAAHIKKWLLRDLAKYPLCDFFLRRCVESMSRQEIGDDLAEDPDLSLLSHFGKPDEMTRLEEFFARTMRTFRFSREGLKAAAKTHFNFDVYDLEGFESVRGVFRVANALSGRGFTEFVLLGGTGLADLKATKNGQRWYIEVKTLVLQTKAHKFKTDEGIIVLPVDKFQPASNRIDDYVESVSRQVVGNDIEKARQQLIKTVEKQGEGKKMIALVVNLFAAGFFLDAENMDTVYKRLRGESNGWEKDYLNDVDGLAFLTDEIRLYPL